MLVWVPPRPDVQKEKDVPWVGGWVLGQPLTVARPRVGSAPNVDDSSGGCLLSLEPPFSPFFSEGCRRASDRQCRLEGVGVDGDGPSATPDDIPQPCSSVLDADSAVVKVWEMLPEIAVNTVVSKW